MQAVFFLSLFSLVFLMFSSMTAGLGKNIMQANVEKIVETRKMFEQVETALNVLVFKQKDSSGKAIVDLSKNTYTMQGGSFYDFTKLDGEFLAQHVSYTKYELKTDLWGKDIKLFINTENEQIWGGTDTDGSPMWGKAPISTIMLISAGPNNYFDTLEKMGVAQTATGLDKATLEQFDISDEENTGDDIVVRFNNYEAMYDIWKKSEDLDFTVKNVALEFYKSRLDAFSPLIQLAQRDVNMDGLLGDDIFGDGADADNDGIPDGLDDSVDYDPFKDLGNSNAFTNEWNNPKNSDNSDNDIHTVLYGGKDSNGTDYDGYRVAKDYENEFVLSLDTTESDELNKDFRCKYKASGSCTATTKSIDFLYPSFDAVEKNDSGGTLPGNKQGLHNLGVSNISSIDPFFGIKGALGYDYDETKPNIIKMKRVTGDQSKDKWNINKIITVDGLGGV